MGRRVCIATQPGCPQAKTHHRLGQPHGAGHTVQHTQPMLRRQITGKVGHASAAKDDCLGPIFNNSAADFGTDLAVR